MADSASMPPCIHVFSKNICSKNQPLFLGQRHASARMLQREYLKKGHLASQFKRSTACLARSSFCTALKGIRCTKNSSFKCFCLGMLMNPENSVTNNWNFAANQILLTVSVIFAYLAGVIPRDGTFSGVGDVTKGSDHNASTNSNGRSTKSISNDYWNETMEKLMDALSTSRHDISFKDKVSESNACIKKSHLNLFAVDEGPRLRLIWFTLQQLQKEVTDISGKNEFVPRDIWLEVSFRAIKGAVLPIFKEWILGELNLEIQECDAKLTSKMLDKVKGDDRILQNINRVGKSELYSDFLFFLRFGSLSAGCCYDTKLLSQHGVDILEDLIVMLADTVASIYLELTSIDSDFSTEMNSLGLTLCTMSSRTLQKLRNEVVLNQWLQEYFDSVICMYEDCFELHVLIREQLDNPTQTQNNIAWWQKLPFQKSATTSSLSFVTISQFSLPVKRTKELRALAGWRYYFSLYLELCDISMPFIKAVFTKLSNAVSFLLVCMIGRSVGLIFSGIRQSLGWRPLLCTTRSLVNRGYTFTFQLPVWVRAQLSHVLSPLWTIIRYKAFFTDDMPVSLVYNFSASMNAARVYSFNYFFEVFVLFSTVHKLVNRWDLSVESLFPYPACLIDAHVISSSVHLLTGDGELLGMHAFQTTETCMAADQSRVSSNGLLLYWFLFFLFLHALLQPQIHITSLSNTTGSSNRRLLSSPSSSRSMKLHPERCKNTTSEFESSKHEVPSGPNPVAN